MAAPRTSCARTPTGNRVRRAGPAGLGNAVGVEDEHVPVLHRDLKSLNLLVTDTFSVKISDFGMSKESESSAPGEKPQFLGIREQRVTAVLIALAIGGSKADTFALGGSVMINPPLQHNF